MKRKPGHVQFKVLPEAPDSLEFVERAQRAVPLVPGSEADCCARLMDRTGLDARDAAREWLTFLRAVGLVAVGERGFSRTDRDPCRARLAEAFRERIFAVGDVLAALHEADQPLDDRAVFARVRDRVPPWERNRHTDWADVWSGRVRRILDWAVLLDLAARANGGYRPA